MYQSLQQLVCQGLDIEFRVMCVGSRRQGADARRTARLATAGGDDVVRGGQYLIVPLEQFLAKANPGRDAIVDRDGRQCGESRSGFGQHPDVTRIAHQIQRRNLAQHVGQAAQGAAYACGRLRAMMAGPAHCQQIRRRIGPLIIVVHAAPIAELAEGAQEPPLLRRERLEQIKSVKF